MGQGFLIDTNAAIDVLDYALPPAGMAFMDTIPAILSEVSRMELLGWTGATPAQLAPIVSLLSKTALLPINEAVILKTIEVRQRKKIKLGDAVIAATALVYGLTLITCNTADFKGINGLDILDPHKL